MRFPSKASVPCIAAEQQTSFRKKRPRRTMDIDNQCGNTESVRLSESQAVRLSGFLTRGFSEHVCKIDKKVFNGK